MAMAISLRMQRRERAGVQVHAQGALVMVEHVQHMIRERGMAPMVQVWMWSKGGRAEAKDSKGVRLVSRITRG